MLRSRRGVDGGAVELRLTALTARVSGRYRPAIGGLEHVHWFYARQSMFGPVEVGERVLYACCKGKEFVGRDGID